MYIQAILSVTCVLIYNKTCDFVKYTAIDRLKKLHSILVHSIMSHMYRSQLLSVILRVTQETLVSTLCKKNVCNV